MSEGLISVTMRLPEELHKIIGTLGSLYQDTKNVHSLQQTAMQTVQCSGDPCPVLQMAIINTLLRP